MQCVPINFLLGIEAGIPAEEPFVAQARVRVKLEGFEIKVGGFEVEIIGERGEVPQLKAAAMEQVRNLLTPATGLVDASAQRVLPLDAGVVNSVPAVPATANRGGRRTNRSPPRAAQTEGTPLDWKPDTQRWGEPRVTWSNFQKGAWLLYCYTKESQNKGLPAGIIAATFNRHFPHAKRVVVPYLERDLARNGQGEKPKVSEDPSQTPSVWYLTEFGEQLVESLMANTKSGPTNGAA